MEFDKRTPGGASSTGRLKLASASQTAWNVGTAPTSVGGSVEGRNLAIAANTQSGDAMAAWVELGQVTQGTEWRIRAATFGANGVAAPTDVITIPDASLGRVDKLVLRFNADGTPELFWLLQTWRVGTGDVGSSALWRATLTNTGWRASQLRRVADGTIDGMAAWGGDSNGQAGVAWLEHIGTTTRLLTASAADLLQGQPTVVAAASAMTEVQAEKASGIVALAWRASECSGAIRQSTLETVKPLAVAAAVATPFATCMTVREGAGAWKDVRMLGALTSNEFDTAALAVRPSGEILVVWSGEVGAYKQVAAASCSVASCSAATTLATPNMGAIARAAVTATTSGFAVSWVDIDPYAQYLTAPRFVRMTPAGALVGDAAPVRGVFYGSGMSPIVKDPALVAAGDNVLMGWRTERYNTDATSDFNAAWRTP